MYYFVNTNFSKSLMTNDLMTLMTEMPLCRNLYFPACSLQKIPR